MFITSYVHLYIFVLCLTACYYYGFPEHRSDPSVGQVTGCHSQPSTYLNSAGNPGETEMKAKRCIRVGYIPLYDMNIYN